MNWIFFLYNTISNRDCIENKYIIFYKNKSLIICSLDIHFLII